MYRQHGGPDVLGLEERPVPAPGPGEVRVRIHLSGVNPTDWKARTVSVFGFSADGQGQVPHQDGAGTIDAVGAGVPADRVGQRVWIWEAAWQRANGTAQEYVVLPQAQAVALPDHASFELGASLGIPALTAHRCLTVADGGPRRLAPGALAGRTVLVAGGAGAVGNAAIQLSRWAGATVVTTVSGPAKAALARAAGAHHVVDYRADDAASAIRALVPGGVDLVVEVAPAVNAGLDHHVAAPHATIACYADTGADTLAFPVHPFLFANLRWQGVLVYTLPEAAKADAVAAVTAAVADGALRVGDDAGLPLHRFPLEKTGDAQAAVQRNVVGKVLVEVATD
ncbi:NADPH:quinone reductase [Streptomyces sp. CB02959]|uniref:NADPH:quinone reductase n=1 Tax=unclassified Streptomyces TaxID=2593676 RepID=UPI0027E4AF84|nr:NADPH:quinone reductase [Streptomyces sp. CB02959]